MPLTELVHYFNKRRQFARAGSEEDSLEFDGQRVYARFAGHVLGSLFQPLAERGGRVLGHEAHLQAWGNGRALPAQAVFLDARSDEELVRLDRLVRTLHALNFLLQREQAGGILALNVHPRLVRAVPDRHGQVFESVLSRCGLTPDRVVLELADDGLSDPAPLAAAIAEYQERGYRIALDNFGRHSSELGRLEALAPDIVKLDRSLSGRARPPAPTARIAAALVTEIRRRGMQAVGQHIENTEQLQYAKELGVDWLQGFLIGRPALDCRPIARPRRIPRVPVAA